jgi:hypothetical protein
MLQGVFDDVPGLTQELSDQLTELRAWAAYFSADRCVLPAKFPVRNHICLFCATLPLSVSIRALSLRHQKAPPGQRL